jgi:hypothetical protein
MPSSSKKKKQPMASIANHTGEWLPLAFARGIGTSRIAALLLVSCVCSANQIQKLSVTHLDGEYRLVISSVLDAPADYAYRVITDYQHAYRINPSIVEAEVLPANDAGVIRVRHRSEHWVGPFRFHLDWAGDITSEKQGELEVITVPELSSFESGYAVWKIRPQGERTLVEYASSLKPKFFIPPVIGATIMENRIKEDTLATFRRIECHAKLMFELDLEQKPEYLRKLLAGREACIKLES